MFISYSLAQKICKVKGVEPLKMLIYAKKVYVKIKNFVELRGNNVQYKTYPDIRGIIYIFNKGIISFGDGVKINSGRFPNPVGGALNTIISVDPDAELSIGNNVGISNAEIVVKKKVTISDEVMIGGGVKIYDSDFHPINYNERKMTPNEGVSKPVFIKRGAFIGAHSIILKGVTIGENSVIGAGSIVTQNIPDNEVWAGNPAKFIRGVKK